MVHGLINRHMVAVWRKTKLFVSMEMSDMLLNKPVTDVGERRSEGSMSACTVPCLQKIEGR